MNSDLSRGQLQMVVLVSGNPAKCPHLPSYCPVKTFTHEAKLASPAEHASEGTWRCFFFVGCSTAAFWLWICLTGKQKSAEEDNQILRSSFESWGFLAFRFWLSLESLESLGWSGLEVKTPAFRTWNWCQLFFFAYAKMTRHYQKPQR